MTLARGRPSYANIGSKRLFQETLHHPASVNRMRATSNVRGAGDHALGCAAAGPARIFLACCGSDNLLAKNQNLRLAAHIGLEQSEFSPLDDLARPLKRWLRVVRFS